MDYQLVPGDSLERLESAVGSWIRLGYAPTGGPFRVRRCLFWSTWYQAVARQPRQWR